MDRLKGKVAIITGAAGGICHKASELFCQEGAKVVMVDIDPQVEQFSAEINANGGASIAVVADVAQRDTWVKLKKLAELTRSSTARRRSRPRRTTGRTSRPR